MKFRQLLNIIKNAFTNFKQNNPLQMAGATAFFTTFALPPILLIFIQIIGLFYNPDAVKKGIFFQLVSVLGKESSINIYHILEQFQSLAQNWLVAVCGFIFLLFVATTLFAVVRKSVNEIWCIKVEQSAGLAFYLKLRLKSLIVIFFAGILLIIQLAAAALQVLLKNYINEVWSDYNSIFYRTISQLIFLIIATGWFTILFRYLANAHPDWKTAFAGGFFTAIFFAIGKTILGLLLTVSNVKTIFGASGSFVLILLFVFYSSFIFYYGAAFTKAWAKAKHKNLQLEDHAYIYELKEIRS